MIELRIRDLRKAKPEELSAAIEMLMRFYPKTREKQNLAAAFEILCRMEDVSDKIKD